MTTLMRIKLSELNPEIIQEWKQKYGDAQLEIMVDSPNTSSFTEDDFWDIIALFDWSKEEEDDAAIIEPAVVALTNAAIDDIRQFEEMLAQKLYFLDTPAHAEASLRNDYSDYLSVDGFLYDRCCVVAAGRDFYHQVLQDPNEFPAGHSFEKLLSLASFVHFPSSATKKE